MSSKKEVTPYVCPSELSGSLDNGFRKFFQNPDKILARFVAPGMRVLDMGCGPGYFSLAMARLMQGSGKIFAADLQQGMLDKVAPKISATSMESVIKLHKCEADAVNINEALDFILAFYMVHEVPDQYRFLEEMKSLLKPNGKMLIVEPWFHVPKRSFRAMIQIIKDLGMSVSTGPKIFFSRSIVVHKK